MPNPHKLFRLGKHPKKTDRRTLQLARYLPTLPTPPTKIDHASKLPANIGMMGNDVYGDCTVAAAGHMIQSWSVYADGLLTIPDSDIIAAYKIVSPNDDGAYLLDVLNLWKKTGVGVDKIEGFVETGMADLIQAKISIQYFGSAYIGMSLPNTNTFGPWDVPNPTWSPNPYNGHAVNLMAYDDSRQMFKVATWGEIWDMSYGWFRKYCDESYAVLNDLSLLSQTGKTPEGFDWNALVYDLQHIGDPIVDPIPEPTPTPTPTPSGPIDITGLGGAYWVVYLNDVAQTPQHSQQFEAVQHIDKLRWENPNAKLEIKHNVIYVVK